MQWKISGCLSELLRPGWNWKEEEAAGKGGAEETAGGTSQAKLGRRQSPVKTLCCTKFQWENMLCQRACFWNIRCELSLCSDLIVEAQVQSNVAENDTREFMSR